VVTNNVVAAWFFMLMGSEIVAQLHVVGTKLNAHLGAFQVPDEKKCLDCILSAHERFATVLLGCNFISYDEGPIVEDHQQIPYKAELMRKAMRIWVPVDHTKVGVKSDEEKARGSAAVLTHSEWEELRPKAKLIVDAVEPAILRAQADLAKPDEIDRLRKEKTAWRENLSDQHFVEVKRPAPKRTIPFAEREGKNGKAG